MHRQRQTFGLDRSVHEPLPEVRRRLFHYVDVQLPIALKPR
jgi:hypothetical protein